MITCPICEMKCDSDRGLKIHMGRKHKEDSENSTKKTKVPQKVPVHTYSVPLGTVLKLSGEVFCQDPETKTFSLTSSDGLSAKVVHKEFQPQANKTFLFCFVYRVVDRLWAILEEDVLNNKFEIVSWGEISNDSEILPSAPSADIDMVDTFDSEAREAYLQDVEKYAKMRDEKIVAEKAYAAVDKEIRPRIIDYLTKYGVETEKGRGDSKLIDGGWSVHYTNSTPTVCIERDEGRIVQWCIENGATDCLKKVLNVEAWEELKREGLVPAEFIKEVEIPREKPASRKFFVERDLT